MGWLDRLLGRARPDAGVREDMPRLPGGAPVGQVYEETDDLAEVGGAWWATRGRAQRTKYVSAAALDAGNTARVIADFEDAGRGFTAGRYDLIEDCRIRDPRLHALCSTRVLAVQSRSYVIRPPAGFEGNASAQRTARNVSLALSRVQAQFALARGHLASGAINGLGLVEHDWKVTADGWRVPVPRFVHPNRTAWNISTEKVHRCEPGTQKLSEYALSDHPDKFAIHAPTLGFSTYPWRRGAMTPGLTILSMTKRMGVRWMMQLMERWGQPQVYATFEGTGASEGINDTITEALERLSTHWQAFFPKGTKLDKLAGSGEVSSELHARFLDLVNIEEAIALLGQNLTTEIGQHGSYAAAEVADQIRQTLLLADLAELDATITEQIIEPIVRYNWPGEAVPVIRHQLVGKRPIAAGEYQTGAFTADELRESLGYAPWGGEEGARRYPVAAAVATNPAGIVAPDGAVEDGDVPAGAETVADLALNGAQVTSLLEIVAQVAAGQLPRDTGVSLISLAFPSLSPQQVETMMGSVGAGFVPAPEDGAPRPAPQPQPGEPAPDAPPPREVDQQINPSIGDRWRDTVDGHLLEVTNLGEGRVYLVDLDEDVGQWSWTLKAFLDRCRFVQAAE